MTYLILIISSVILALNIRASFFIIRSSYNGRSQKAVQMAFVWLLPFIGAIATAHIHKGIGRECRSVKPYNAGAFEYEADWALSHDLGTIDHASPGSEC
jgi:hypothetical protein